MFSGWNSVVLVNGVNCTTVKVGDVVKVVAVAVVEETLVVNKVFDVLNAEVLKLLLLLLLTLFAKKTRISRVYI